MEKFLIREKIIKIIREYFYTQDFHEVITPILHKALPLEPNLHPFATIHEYKDIKETFYLAMSPERGIKSMLAAGMDTCFAISKSFRNYERVGSLHNHEFLMLEWYRKGSKYIDIMNDVEQLLKVINAKIEPGIAIPKTPLLRISLNDLFNEKVGISLERLLSDDALLIEVAKKKGYTVTNTSWEELYDQLFVNEIEATLPQEPFFLIDFPARISPLCTRQKEKPLFAERFELYINAIEIGNGNTENTDTEAIKKAFEKEHKKTGMPVDKEFLTFLEAMKKESYAGVGIGIDRLVKLYAKTDIFV